MVALPRQSVFAQLRPTPRIFVFFSVLLLTSLVIGAREVARFQYLNRFFDSELIIGVTAAVTAITVAVSSLVVGRLIDRSDPRPFLNWSLALASFTLLLPALALYLGFMSIWFVLGLAAFDGVIVGTFSVSLLKTQALLVRPGATGAAEILNFLRLGLGGIAGALIAGASPSTELTLIVGTALLLVASMAIWLVTAPAAIRASEAGAKALTETVMGYLRANTLVRNLVVLDLILVLVIPTQLVNFVLFDYDVAELASQSIAAGLAGVFFGRVLLTVFGFRGKPRVIITVTTLALAVIQVLSAVSLVNDWVLGQDFAAPVLIFLGSACAIYCQGLFSAMLQQEMAENMRGRISGLLVTGRNIAISAGALIGAAIITPLGSQQLLLLLSVSLVVVVVASGGFRALKQL